MPLDFDGVFMDPKPYAEAIKRELVRSLSELTGFERETVYQDFEQGTADVLANPTKYGWKGDGILACFGTEDPFIMNHASVGAMASRKPAYARKVADEYKTDIGWFRHKVHNEVTREEIALKNNDYTPEWSRKFVEEHGRVVDDLKELLDLIGQHL